MYIQIKKPLKDPAVDWTGTVSHLKQSQCAAGWLWSRLLWANVCGADPGRLHQDNHLDDGKAESADGPEDANGPGAPHKLSLVQAGKVGKAGRHQHH